MMGNSGVAKFSQDFVNKLEMIESGDACFPLPSGLSEHLSRAAFNTNIRTNVLLLRYSLLSCVWVNGESVVVTVDVLFLN